MLLQQPDGRNQSGSGADLNLDFLETLEPANRSPEWLGSAESSTVSSSSDSSVLAKSRNRNKTTKSVKSCFGTSQGSTVFNTTGTDFDGLDVFALEESINNLSEVEKPVKKSSRKKRKMRGKQYKTSGQRKALALSQCEEICNAPLSEKSDPDSPYEHISQIMLEKVNSSGLSVHDIEEDISVEPSIDCRNKSSTPVTCTSLSNGMPNSELLASSPWEFSSETPSSDQSSRCEGLNRAMSSCSTTSTETILLMSPGRSSNDHAKQNGTCENFAVISDDQDNCSEANSFLNKLKIDTFGNCSDVENCDNTAKQSPVKDEYGCDSLEVGLSFNLMGRDASSQSITELWVKSSEMSTCCTLDYPDWSKYVLDADCTNERVQSSSEASSSNDFQPIVNKKRGRFGRKPSFNSNSLHNQGGKGNYHQGNGTGGCICRSKDDIVCQHIDISPTCSDDLGISGEVEGREQNARAALCNCRCSDETAVKDPIQSASNDFNSTDLLKAVNGRLLHDCLEKLKRKPISSLNQESKGFMKELQKNKISMTRESKVYTQKERVEVTQQVINHKQIGHQSTYLGTMELRNADDIRSNMLGYCRPELLQDKQINTVEAQNGLSSLPVESDLLGKPYIKLHSNGSDHVVNQNIKLETERMHSENSRPENTSGPALQKYSVVGRKNSVSFDKNCSHISIVNDPIPDRLHYDKIKIELPISNFHHSVSSSSVELPCSNSPSEGMESTCSLPPDVDELSCRFKSRPFPVQNFSGVAAGESQTFAGFETDLCRIVQAVAESYKLLKELEALCLMTGRLLGGFERFLHAATPIISQSSRNCKTCSQDQISGDALCIHQVPHISLQNLWQSYEKLGSYGLEVKVDDHYNSKGSRSSCSQFRAYFVPYLSAVQLFARSSSSVCFNNGVSNGVNKKFCEHTTSKSSRSLESLPIFSVLLPQPRKVVSSDKVKTYCQTNNSSNLIDEELIFEYFEADHPPLRKPLHEK